MNKIELLGELKKLYDDGLIDKSEYDLLKQKILADPSVSAKTNVDSSQSQGFDLEKPKPISNKPNQTRAEEPTKKSQNKKLIFGIVIILAVLTVFYFFTNSKSIAVSEAVADVAESKIDDALDNTDNDNEKDLSSESEERYVLPKEGDIYLDSRFDETFEDFKEKYLKKEINFADYFIIDEFGCGMCCSFIQMIDTRNGQVYSGPGTWGEGGASDAKFQKNSNEFTTYYYDCLEDNWVDSTIYTWDDKQKKFEQVNFDYNNCDSISPLHMNKIERSVNNTFTFFLEHLGEGTSYEFNWQLNSNTVREGSFERRFIDKYGNGNESTPYNELIDKCFKVVFIGKYLDFEFDQYGNYSGKAEIVKLVELDMIVCENEWALYGD